MTKFEKITQVSGAFDKRHADPKKNYGIHGMEMRFILKGPNGAVQFVFFSGQYLKHVSDELLSKHKHGKYNPFHGMGADIGYHSPRPKYKGQECGDCDLLPGGKCYYDGSSLQASEFEDEFLAGGDRAVWLMLEKRYEELFGDDKP